jgi:hypothetical protein
MEIIPTEKLTPLCSFVVKNLKYKVTLRFYPLVTKD